MGPTGYLCKRHGGNFTGPDDGWYCDECARSGINKCKCGGHARYFGEALMCTVRCESCDEYIAGIDIPAIQMWNVGIRGYIN